MAATSPQCGGGKWGVSDHSGVSLAFYALVALILLLFATVAATMVARMVLRRRVKKAERDLPEARFSGPAVLVGTSVSDDLSGVGALALTDSRLVFVVGATGFLLDIPLARAQAWEYRTKPTDRRAALRVEWDGNAAVFDVHKPGLQDWLERLPTGSQP